MANDREEGLLFSRRAVEASIHIALVAVLVVACFRIIGPFLLPVIWAMVLAIALSGFFEKFAAMIGGRRKTAAAVFVLLGLAILLAPTWLLLSSATEGIVSLGKEFDAGTFELPAPPENIEE